MTGRKRGAGIRAFLIATTALAAPVPAALADTLQDALMAAYSTNPQLAAERARLRATDENVPIARAGWRPTITVTGSYGYQHTRTVGPTLVPGIVQTHPTSGDVTARQTIFDGLRTPYAIREAKARSRAGRATLDSVEQDVLGSVVTAYLDVLRDQAVVDLNRSNVDVLRRELQATNDRFNVGELTRTDVSQAEARLAGALSQLTQAEANLITSRATYERIVGQKPGTLAPPPPLPLLPATEEEALEVALRENPALAAARETETASRYGVEVARADLWPNISVRGRLSHNEQTISRASQTDSKSLVAEITVPIYQGGSEWARIRQAKQTNSESLMRIAVAERQVRQDVSNAWEQLRAARAQIKSDEEQVRANEIAYDGVRQEALVGSRTTLDVLDAEQELLNARVALVTSQRNEYVAAYQVLAAIGRLSAQELGLPVKPYDPQTYYRKVNHKPFGWDTKTRD
jgi:outer membrane protein